MQKDYSSQEGYKRQPFKLTIPVLSPEEEHPELETVQALLETLEYLTPTYQSSRLDGPTRQALKKYQAFHKLKQTGTTDEATVDALEQPRCGTPDPNEFLRPAADEFVLEAFGDNLRRSPDCTLIGLNPVTYTIANTPEELPNELDFDEVKGAIEAALATWQKVILVDFEPAQNPVNATFSFKWVTGGHNDTQRFDHIGGLLAHAFYPKGCGRGFSGQCHFDKAERWGLNDILPLRTFDLETVALHEIGHLLGLVHSTDRSSTMFDQHIEERRKLSSDVIGAIQGIYGVRPS